MTSGVERGRANKRPLRWGHGLPMRGSSHLIICPYGSPLDGIRSIAFLTKRHPLADDFSARLVFRLHAQRSFALNGG